MWPFVSTIQDFILLRVKQTKFSAIELAVTHVHLHDLDKTFLLLLEQELSNLFFVPLAASAPLHWAVMPDAGCDPERVTRVHLIQN